MEPNTQKIEEPRRKEEKREAFAPSMYRCTRFMCGRRSKNPDDLCAPVPVE